MSLRFLLAKAADLIEGLNYVFSFEIFKEKAKKTQAEGMPPYTLVVHSDDEEVTP